MITASLGGPQFVQHRRLAADLARQKLPSEPPGSGHHRTRCHHANDIVLWITIHV